MFVSCVCPPTSSQATRGDIPEDRWQTAAQFRDALDEWIRRTTRVSSRDLAMLIGRVINSPTADLERGANHEIVEPESPSGLSGPSTRMSMAAAEMEAQAARAEFIAGEGVPDGISATGTRSPRASDTSDGVRRANRSSSRGRDRRNN